MSKKPRTANQTIPTTPDDAMDLSQARPSSVSFPQVITDREFTNFLDPGTDEDLAKLYDKVLSDGGFRDPVVIWKETKDLLDGNRRRRVWEKYFHSDPAWAPKVVEISFPDRQAAKKWIIENQTIRRNLTDAQRGLMAIKLKSLYAELAKKNRDSGVSLQKDKGEKSIDTMAELGKLANLGRDTMFKVQNVAKHGTPAVVQAMKNDEISISDAAKAAALPPEEQNEFLENARTSKTQPKKTNTPRPAKAAPEIKAPPEDASSAQIQPCEHTDKVSTIDRHARELLRDVNQGDTSQVDSPAKIAVLRSAKESLQQILEVNDPQPPSSAPGPEMAAAAQPANPHIDKSPTDQPTHVIAENPDAPVGSGTMSAKEMAEPDIDVRVSALEKCIEWIWKELDPAMGDIRASAPSNCEAIEKQFARFYHDFAKARTGSIQFFRECRARN